MNILRISHLNIKLYFDKKTIWYFHMEFKIP